MQSPTTPLPRRIAQAAAILILAMFAWIIAPAGKALAHTGGVTITCPTPTAAGSASFSYDRFPAGHQVVNRDVTVDTLTVAGSGKFSFQGPRGQGALPFTIPADGQPHTVRAVTTWQADGGGTAQAVKSCVLPVPTTPPPAPPSCGTTVTCPPPTVIDRTVTIIQRVEVPAQPAYCTSKRTIRWLIRRNYPGSRNASGRPVLGIDMSKRGPVVNGVSAGRGIYTGFDADGKVIRTQVRKLKTGKNRGRWQATVFASGHRFTGLNNALRVTVWLKTRAGTFRTSYFADTCRQIAGNPNDQRSRSPEIPG